MEIVGIQEPHFVFQAALNAPPFCTNVGPTRWGELAPADLNGPRARLRGSLSNRTGWGRLRLPASAVRSGLHGLLNVGRAGVLAVCPLPAGASIPASMLTGSSAYLDATKLPCQQGLTPNLRCKCQVPVSADTCPITLLSLVGVTRGSRNVSTQ